MVTSLALDVSALERPLLPLLAADPGGQAEDFSP